MIISPDTYYKALNQGVTDEQLAPELARKAGKDINKLRAAGLTDGQVARYFSGIDEIDFQHQQNPAPERGILGDVAHATAVGATSLTDKLGYAAKAVNEKQGTKVQDSLTALSNYAKQNLGILRPDESNVKGEGYVKEGVMSGIESAVPSVAPGLGGAAIGGLIGSALGPVGTAVGSFAGSTIGTLLVYGLGTFQEKKEEYLAAGIDEKTANEKAAWQGAIEGGIETASNLVGLATFGVGKVATQPLKQTARQLLKTPMKTFAKKLTQNALLNEIPTEMLQSALASKIDENLGLLPEGQWQEEAVKAIIPAFTMSVIFGVGAQGLTSTRKASIKAALNNKDGNVRTQAAKQVADLIKEKDLKIAWAKMADDRIANQQPIDINLDFTKFDPTAKDQSTDETFVPEGKPEGWSGVAPEDTPEPTKVKAESTEEPVVSEGELGEMLDTDLRPYRKDRPYKSAKQAEGALKGRKYPEGKTVDDYEVVEVKGGAVIREKVKEQKPLALDNERVADLTGMTLKEYEELKPEQQRVAKEEAQVKILKTQTKLVKGVTESPVVESVKPTEAETKNTKPQDHVVKTVNDKLRNTNITFDGEQDRTALKKGPLYYFTPQEGELKGRTFSTESMTPSEVISKYNAMLAAEPDSSVGRAKTTKVPYKGTNPSVKEMSEFDPAEAREELRINKISQVALEQTREATLEENDFVPWPVSTYVKGAQGEKVAGNLSWINEPAIEAMPREERPSGAVTAQTLQALERKGLIKKAKYTDGKMRWVPADWKAPAKAKTVLRKTEPKVKVKRLLENGDVAEVEVPVKEALTETDDQITALEKLIHCME